MDKIQGAIEINEAYEIGFAVTSFCHPLSVACKIH
jgi:hypothetical protein